MRLELAKHLDKAGDTVFEVERILSSDRYSSDKRTVMTRRLLSAIIQHHRGMLILIKSGIIDSLKA